MDISLFPKLGKFSQSETIEIDSLEKLLQYSDKNFDRPTRIIVKPGLYCGNFKFRFSNVYLVANGVSLVGSRYANELDENGQERTTWKTATLTITGSNNYFEGLEVINDSGNPKEKGQEVALSVFGSHNVFDSCGFSSTQDTLFVGPLPDDLQSRYINFIPEDERLQEGNLENLFLGCRIAGSLDFIFGAGQATFFKCQIVSLPDGRDIQYVAAPSHSNKDEFGFFFDECEFTSKSKEEIVYLARPWRDYGKCVFLNCIYGPHIKKEGFSDWNNESRYRTARFLESPLKETRVNWAKDLKNSSYYSMYLKADKDIRGL